MKISLQGVADSGDRKQWEEKGYSLPQYDIAQVARATKENPFWIHFGAGNLFRAFHAAVAQNLLNAGKLDRGILVAEGFDYEIIEKMYAPHDNLGIAVTLRSDGTIDKQVIGSVAEALPLDSADRLAFARLKGIFANDSLQMATFTITEKGYCLTDAKGALLPDVAADFAAGPEKPASYMGKVSALLYARYLAGEKPVAMVSTDNCSHNGDKLYAAVSAFAGAWVDGLQDTEPVVTSRNTYTAPFVNAEETEYLVVEDDFPNGRPGLEEGGILFTDRATVDKVEKMKVCTCLNPLHTCLAIFGCLLGYQKISDEMRDQALVRLVERVGYQEGLPVVVNPGVLDPKEFIDTVLRVRVTNPFMPDTPQRIATDSSQNFAIRFGETIKAYQADANRSVEDLQMIPLVLAGWLRYLMAVDDSGKSFEPSPDPLLATLLPQMAKLRLGDTDVEAVLRPIMENVGIFGVDLYAAGLADRVCGYFKELSAGVGAVRRVLEKYSGL